MSFPRYRNYKDSGFAWLGEVPAHWALIPFSHGVQFQEGPGIMAVDFHNEGVPLLRVSGAQGRWASLQGCNYLDPVKVSKQWDHFRLKLGDLVISASASMGTVCEVGLEAEGAIPYTGLIRLTGKREALTNDFIRAIVASTIFSTQIDILKSGTTIQHFGPTHLRQVKILAPPLAEQASITRFLDRETAKIDTLVEQQQRLIELLKEKRQADISHAVTRGLNHLANMKPSGVLWLGEVPEHWDVKQLRRFSCVVQTGPFGSQLHADEYVAGGTPVINPVNMVNGRIVPSEDITVGNDVLDRLRHQRLQVGDVIFSRRGELGRCALVTEAEDGWLCGTGSMILRLCNTEYHSGYLSYFLSLSLLRQYFESFSIGAIMDSLSSATLLAMPMIVPPVEEQAEIVAYITRESAKLDALTAEALRAIDLLQERRAALLSTAVTGKIDVRGLAEAEAA